MQPEAFFPPFGINVSAGPLTLRLLRDEDFGEYGALLRQPIFDDEATAFVFPWYAVDPEERIRNSVQYHWGLRSSLRPEAWTLPFGVFAEGRLVGQQDISATEFARRGVVGSGSWLTSDVHGRGWGRLMRQAVLVLAFDHLGAQRAESEAIVGNERSLAVSRSCGYALNGTYVDMYGDRVVEQQRVVVTPESFVRPTERVQAEGLTSEVFSMLGAQGSAEPDDGVR